MDRFIVGSRVVWNGTGKTGTVVWIGRGRAVRVQFDDGDNLLIAAIGLSASHD